MGSHSGAHLLAFVAAGLASLASGCKKECEAAVACVTDVTVTLKQSMPVDDQELTFEVAFDGRVLRCRASKAAPTGTCDLGLHLQVRIEQPDAGPSRDKPLEWPAAVEGVRLQDVMPAELTVRIQRSDATLAEQSFNPSYTGGYSESCCQTSFNSHVWM